jgi:hypothetical protein
MIDMGDGQISTPLIDATNAKISNPSLDCSSLRDPDWALSDQDYLYAPEEPEEVDWSNYVAPISVGSANDFNGAQEESNYIATSSAGSANDINDDQEEASVPLSDGGSETANSGSSSSSSGDACPLEYTGYYATARCESYVYCEDGDIVGAVLPCVPGTLFDVTIGVCTWADTVQCGS